MMLRIENLNVRLPIRGRQREVVAGVSLEIDRGEAVGLVGESGSGKSMTARAIVGLLPVGAEVTGSITFDGRDVLTMSSDERRRYRTDSIGLVSQDPRAAVNPVRRISDFLTEALRANRGVGRVEAERRAVELLDEVGIDDPPRRMRQFPHELSGGMLQRVVIAATLVMEPRLIIADEPTTALDVTTQSEVMAIIEATRRKHGISLLFISHDLDLAAAVCDRTAVMYAGMIVEQQPSESLHRSPQHPYTAGLAASRPLLSDPPGTKLQAIPGRPVSAYEAPSAACPFTPRCPYRQQKCEEGRPPLIATGRGATACVRWDEITPLLSDDPGAE